MYLKLNLSLALGMCPTSYFTINTLFGLVEYNYTQTEDYITIHVRKPNQI